jgi:Flp pilus assembly protein TadD
MHFMKSFAIAAILSLLLTSPCLLDASPVPSVSGRLIFDSGFGCDPSCTVTLMAFGVRPVQTVTADISGRFSFVGVPRGSYTLRIEIPGFEPVTQNIDAVENGMDLTILVPPLKRATTSAATGSGIVDLSEFNGRYPKKAVSYFEKGIDCLKKKKNDDAVKYLREAVELAPTFFEAHNQLGLAYQETGSLEDAEREFLTAHRLNSTNVQPLVNLTALYLNENHNEQAVKTSEEAVKANSTSASAFFSLGVALFKAAQLDRAESALKRALDLAPRVGDIRLMLANVYLKLQRYDNTVEQLNQYIAENPDGKRLKEAVALRNQLVAANAAGRP